MKYRHWLFVIFSLAVVTGCSSDKSHAKKLILDSFQNPTAVRFGEFTLFDEQNGCYEVSVKNYNGQEKIVYISLKKDEASDQQWSNWVTTNSLDECRDAFK